MIRYAIILFSLIFSNNLLKAQSITFSSYEKLRTIPGTYTSFSIDNLGNIYLLSASNQLKKLNQKGDSVAVFNDVKKFGEATLVDVSNPTKIILYYKNFATIVMLDGMLQQKNTIDLRRKNIFRVKAVSLSYDGKIWLYDEIDHTLKKIDEQGEVLLKTSDLRQVFNQSIAPVKIVDQNQHVYLYDPQQGVYVFDYYGAFKNRIDITGWNNLRIADKHVFGNDSTSIYSYEIPVFKSTRTVLPAALLGYRQIISNNHFFYGLHSAGLDIIKLAGN